MADMGSKAEAETDSAAEDRQFARAFTRFIEVMGARAVADEVRLTPLGELVQEFVGVDLTAVQPVSDRFRDHEIVDIDNAVSFLDGQGGGQVVGINGANRMHVESFLGFLFDSHGGFAPGPVNYLRLPNGPESVTEVVGLGISLMRMDGHPLAVLRRSGNRYVGREHFTLEVLCTDPDTSRRYLDAVRARMASHGIARGQVVSFDENQFDGHSPGTGLTFHHRPDVPESAVVLPDGVIDRVRRHVVGIGQNRAALVDAGQHLKRGVLLYGPPGTGKTHLVRHLLSSTPGTTAVLLSGRTLGLLSEAARLARANQPAMVVLEDCDLVAEERDGDGDATELFETLEVLDGMSGDADVAFVMTTNRPDLLERALIQRPGRVDLAMHIDRPDASARRRLLDLYSADVELPADALDTAAERSDGATASFAKELIRRSVLLGASAGRPAGGQDLLAALDEMMSDGEALTRSLLGGGTRATRDRFRRHADDDDLEEG